MEFPLARKGAIRYREVLPRCEWGGLSGSPHRDSLIARNVRRVPRAVSSLYPRASNRIRREVSVGREGHRALLGNL